MQDVLVALIVAACGLYAVWALMPATLRRAAAGQGARLPLLPARLRGRLQAIAAVTPGCGCNGCDRGGAAPVAPGAPQRVHIVRKPRSTH